MELHDALQELHVVATAPELYSILIDLNSVSSLIGLLVRFSEQAVNGRHFLFKICFRIHVRPSVCR